MQAYRRTSIVAAVASLLAITLPAVILPARLAAPQLFPMCYSLLIIKRPCPMCGLTRGMGSIVWGRFGEALNYNILSLAFFTFFLLEIIFRSYLLFIKHNDKKLKAIKKYDLKIHLALIALYMAYAAYFHIASNW